MTFGGTLLENVCGKQHDSYPFSKLYTVLQKKLSSLLLLEFLTST